MAVNLNWSLRPATSDDREFLYTLHRASMREYVDATWGWDEDWQRTYYDDRFDVDGVSIVMSYGQAIGTLSVSHDDDQVVLNALELLPEYQRRGLGTAITQQVIENAAREGKPVWLQVLKVNPARQLYERLGFDTTGESPTHYHMLRRPEP